MPATRSPRYRPVYVLCIVVACVTGMFAVIWGGGAVSGWVRDLGMARATARVLEVEEGNARSASVVFEFTTGDGRKVRASKKKRYFESGARVGTEAGVVYDPERPASSVRYDQKPAELLPWCALAAVVAVLSGMAAYRTRPDTQP
ncbi:hypothetical protein GCM10009678_19330 [Actinomadura kijaniata]|uniref:DUF3592 domain-containing protein n=1 Tax=Actinomadura namibiensis TaxID=182080 RepID=A0A7W3LXK8_ACTNM|nr:DUF3592 domain-containing protein [Actinomadura namibiensis]MBA8956178.1 hypothetical protein [Actinomadura namibiensis]